MSTSVKATMKHATIYSTAAMLGKMVGFLMLPFYTHILSDNGYAVIGLLDAGVALLVSLLANGVRGANIRFYHDQEDPDRKRAVISTGVILVLGIAALLAGPLMLFATPIAGLLLDNTGYNHLLIIALITFVLEMGGQGASSWLLIQSKSVKFAGINLLRLLIGLSLNIWLIVFLGWGLNGFFISSLVTSIICNGLLMGITFRECGTRFDRPIAREIGRYLLPLIPSGLLSFASRQVERVLVRFQVDFASVGLLEIGYKFPILIAQFVTTPIQQSWNTRRFEISDQPDAPRRIGAMYTYFLFLATFAGLIIAMVIKPLLVILTPPVFHEAYRIAQVEVVTLILQGTFFHLNFGLLYAKHTRTLAIIRGWVAVVKVGLSYYFIATMGIMGAAWSAAIMGAVLVIFTHNYSRRQYALQMEWKKILLIVGTSGGIFAVFSGWDFTGTAVHNLIHDSWLPGFSELVAATPAGDWKDGKLMDILLERRAPMTEATIKGFIAALFGLLLPLVHGGITEKIMARLGRGRGRGR